MGGAVPSLPQCAFMAWCLVRRITGTTFLLLVSKFCPFSSVLHSCSVSLFILQSIALNSLVRLMNPIPAFVFCLNCPVFALRTSVGTPKVLRKFSPSDFWTFHSMKMI